MGLFIYYRLAHVQSRGFKKRMKLLVSAAHILKGVLKEHLFSAQAQAFHASTYFCALTNACHE